MARKAPDSGNSSDFPSLDFSFRSSFTCLGLVNLLLTNRLILPEANGEERTSLHEEAWSGSAGSATGLREVQEDFSDIMHVLLVAPSR